MFSRFALIWIAVYWVHCQIQTADNHDCVSLRNLPHLPVNIQNNMAQHSWRGVLIIESDSTTYGIYISSVLYPLWMLPCILLAIYLVDLRRIIPSFLGPLNSIVLIVRVHRKIVWNLCMNTSHISHEIYTYAGIHLFVITIHPMVPFHRALLVTS